MLFKSNGSTEKGGILSLSLSITPARAALSPADPFDLGIHPYS